MFLFTCSEKNAHVLIDVHQYKARKRKNNKGKQDEKKYNDRKLHNTTLILKK
jgi:hypothetical protein